MGTLPAVCTTRVVAEIALTDDFIDPGIGYGEDDDSCLRFQLLQAGRVIRVNKSGQLLAGGFGFADNLQYPYTPFIKGNAPVAIPRCRHL